MPILSCAGLLSTVADAQYPILADVFGDLEIRNNENLQNITRDDAVMVRCVSLCLRPSVCFG